MTLSATPPTATPPTALAAGDATTLLDRLIYEQVVACIDLEELHALEQALTLVAADLEGFSPDRAADLARAMIDAALRRLPDDVRRYLRDADWLRDQRCELCEEKPAPPAAPPAAASAAAPGSGADRHRRLVTLMRNRLDRVAEQIGAGGAEPLRRHGCAGRDHRGDHVRRPPSRARSCPAGRARPARPAGATCDRTMSHGGLQRGARRRGVSLVPGEAPRVMAGPRAKDTSREQEAQRAGGIAGRVRRLLSLDDRGRRSNDAAGQARARAGTRLASRHLPVRRRGPPGRARRRQ